MLTVGVINIRLPEFSKERKVDGWNLQIFDSSTCQYDMIIGRDFMTDIGIDNSFSTNTIQWIDRSIKMKSPHHCDLMMTNFNCIFEDFEDKDALSEAFAELYKATTLDQAHKKVTPTEYINEQDHMLDKE